MTKDTSVKMQNLWLVYCRLIARSQILPSDTRTYDRLIRRMAKLEQALAMTSAQSLDDLVIKLDLLAWVLFPPADPGVGPGDVSGSTTSRGTRSLLNHAIPTDTTEGLLLGQILTDAHQLAGRPAGNSIKDPIK